MPPPDELVFAPLGGVGEIGMNLSIYGLAQGKRRNWLAVDCGVSFGDEERLPGIDLIMPDIKFLEGEKKNLVGIVLTHAHEDHFGALIDLWPKLQVPVYATPFSAALLEAKLAAERNPPRINVRVVPVGGRVDIGPFSVEFVPVAHSIPESHALAIKTSVGTVLHTGDWKIDPQPVEGPKTDEARLRALGDEGVLALIGDSTNAVRDGRSPSETEVSASLAKIIKAARGRVAITTFASNVSRLHAVAHAAREAGREVVLVGRAMERVVQVARETGHLQGVQEFRSPELFGRFPPDKVVALCTGSQGEQRAAMARIANDDHPLVKLSRGDTVIFSSRTIPGNEKAVGHIVNGLITQGVDVITDRTHLVHVSGHPRRDELRDMISWVKPQLLIPVHGEPLHLAEHAALARAAGVPDVLTCRNGDLIRLGPGPAEIIDELPHGRLYKDGLILEPEAARAVAERRKLAYAGCVFVAIAVTDKGEMVDTPQIELIGVPDKDVAGEDTAQNVYDVVVDTFGQLPRARRRDPDSVAESIRRAVRASVASGWGKKTICVVQVLTV
jgi:ribonuclease J